MYTSTPTSPSSASRGTGMQPATALLEVPLDAMTPMAPTKTSAATLATAAQTNPALIEAEARHSPLAAAPIGCYAATTSSAKATLSQTSAPLNMPLSAHTWTSTTPKGLIITTKTGSIKNGSSVGIDPMTPPSSQSRYSIGGSRRRNSISVPTHSLNDASQLTVYSDDSGSQDVGSTAAQSSRQTSAQPPAPLAQGAGGPVMAGSASIHEHSFMSLPASAGLSTPCLVPPSHLTAALAANPSGDYSTHFLCSPADGPLVSGETAAAAATAAASPSSAHRASMTHDPYCRDIIAPLPSAPYFQGGSGGGPQFSSALPQRGPQAHLTPTAASAATTAAAAGASGGGSRRSLPDSSFSAPQMLFPPSYGAPLDAEDSGSSGSQRRDGAVAPFYGTVDGAPPVHGPLCHNFRRSAIRLEGFFTTRPEVQIGSEVHVFADRYGNRHPSLDPQQQQQPSTPLSHPSGDEKAELVPRSAQPQSQQQGSTATASVATATPPSTAVAPLESPWYYGITRDSTSSDGHGGSRPPHPSCQQRSSTARFVTPPQSGSGAFAPPVSFPSCVAPPSHEAPLNLYPSTISFPDAASSYAIQQPGKKYGGPSPPINSRSAKSK